MIGIDTNVLLRLLVRDDDAQLRAAERFIATHCSPDNPGFVSLVVVVETAWALRRFYLYDRSQIAAALGSLLNVAELEIESAAEVRSAVADFATSAAGLVDCLVARVNVAAGCDYTVTFDRKAAKLAGFQLLKTG
jgi:predicted nucleic-acid-binding protein